MRSADRILPVVLATALVFAAGCASAPPPGEQHGGHEATPAVDEEHGHSEATVRIAESAAETWHEIDRQLELLEATITNGQLADVHRLAFAIRDLAKELPDNSKDLPDAKLQLLRGYVQRIEEHAQNLDTYGDGGNQDKTSVEFEQFKKRLDNMRKLYPDSMFHADGH